MFLIFSMIRKTMDNSRVKTRSLQWHMDLVRHQGGRITPVVSSVLNHLYESGTVHSPQELREDIIRDLSCDIGFPTVYRVLDRLMSAGLVHRMHRNDNQTCFFLCRNPHQTHHHHFICNCCNTVKEIKVAANSRVEQMAYKATIDLGETGFRQFRALAACRFHTVR